MKNLKMKRFEKWTVLPLVMSFSLLIGCGPALVAGGAAGGYKVGSDERSVGDMVDDTSLSTRVKSALIESPDVSAAKIDVDVVAADVTLTGVVSSENEAGKAVEIARGISGVKSVRNNLQIGSLSLGEYVDDTVLVSKVKTELIGTSGVHSLNIDVDSEQGIVTLTGLVGDEKEKTLALEAARSVKGVVRVVDNLKTISN